MNKKQFALKRLPLCQQLISHYVRKRTVAVPSADITYTRKIYHQARATKIVQANGKSRHIIRAETIAAIYLASLLLSHFRGNP